MRRRRNQPHPRRAVPNAGDLLVDLVTGQLPPLARLGPLGHLDLQFAGAAQIFAGHAEPAAGHLLDGAGAIVVVRVELVAGRVLAPLAGVAAAADAVHGDGQRLVRLARDRAVGHGPRGETLDDVDGRLDIVKRERPVAELEFQQPAQREQLPLLIVDQLAELAELLAAVDPRGVLQFGDHLGAEDMGFALAAPLILTAHVQIERFGDVGPRPGVFVPAEGLIGDSIQPHPLDAAGRPGEILVDKLARQADGFEDLGTAIALLRGDAHLRHHLEQPLADRLDVVLFQFFVAVFVAQVAAHQQLVQRGEGQVGIDRPGPIAGEQGEVMHLAGFAGFDHQAAARAAFLADQMMVHAAGGQQGRNRHQLLIYSAVGKDQNRHPFGDGLRGLAAQLVQPPLHPRRPFLAREEHRQATAFQRAGVDLLDSHQVGVGQDRLIEPQQLALGRRLLQQVPLRTDRRHQRSDDLLADRVERRIGHLGEQLLEIVVEQLRTIGEDRQRRVVPHRADRFGGVGGHRGHQNPQVFQRVAKRPLQRQQGLVQMPVDRHDGGQIVDPPLMLANPLPIRTLRGQRMLDLFVGDDPPLGRIDQEHPAGRKRPLATTSSGGMSSTPASEAITTRPSLVTQ